MKVDYVEETSVRKSLSFEIEADVVDREIEARARDYAKKLRLPGFRPGKIPIDVVKTRFKDQVLGDVAETIVNRVVMEELEGRGLRPLASPKVADLKIDEKQPMTFKAVFETLPLVDLPEYRGLSVKVPQGGGQGRGHRPRDRPDAGGSGPLRSGRRPRHPEGRLRHGRPGLAARGRRRAAGTRTRSSRWAARAITTT